MYGNIKRRGKEMRLNLFFKPMTMVSMAEDDDGGGGGGGGEPVALLDDGGNFTDEFYNTFDENDRAAISQYKTPGELGKGHINLRRTFDKPADRVLVLPDDNSSDEERAAFNQRIGVPQEAAGYEFELNPELKNVAIDDDRLNAFREIAKKYDIPKSKFAGLVNDYLALIDKDAGEFELIQQNKEAKAIEADNAVMDEYFGKAKEDRIALADAMLRKYNTEIKNEKGEVVANSVEKLVEKYPDIVHSPWLVMTLDKIREDMSPARIQGLTGVTAPTNAAIRIRIAEIRSKPAYTDMSDPDHTTRLNKEVLELQGQISA
jgi:hypothetical protein